MMTGYAGERGSNVNQWWFWFAVALFLLLPLDLLTTLLAVSKHGLVVEMNPIMQWLLSRGIVAVTVAHLVVTAVVVWLFHAALGWRERAEPSHRRLFTDVMRVWIATLILAGLVVVSNNVLALVR